MTLVPTLRLVEPLAVKFVASIVSACMAPVTDKLVPLKAVLPSVRAVCMDWAVPALDDSGKLLSQSLAIMEYLDEAYPGAKLLPGDPADRAYVRAFSQLIACEIHPLNNLRVLKYIKRSYKLDDEGVNNWYRHWIAEGFASMEAFLLNEKRHGRHVFRDQATMADCCLVPQVFNAQRYDCDLKPYPTVMKIFDQCMKLDAFIAAQPMRQPDAA